MVVRRTVPFVDLDRYLGIWYSIASFPAWFSKQCLCCLSVECQLAQDGKSLFFKNVYQRKDGSIEIKTGLAKILDYDTQAHLTVSFVPFFKRWGWFGEDYKILALADDYSYSVVGNENYLRIFSRTPMMDEAIYDQLIAKIPHLGYDVSRLEKMPQELYA